MAQHHGMTPKQQDTFNALMRSLGIDPATVTSSSYSMSNSEKPVFEVETAHRFKVSNLSDDSRRLLIDLLNRR